MSDAWSPSKSVIVEVEPWNEEKEYPKSKDITAQQQAYIKNYIDTVETYLRDGNMAYRSYISRTSFIDYFIHSELSKNADGMKKSVFFNKEKQQADGSKGKLKTGTVWDYNLAYGNCSFCGVTTWRRRTF